MRLPNAMHLLHAMWQFIACIVGARFIAPAVPLNSCELPIVRDIAV